MRTPQAVWSRFAVAVTVVALLASSCTAERSTTVEADAVATEPAASSGDPTAPAAPAPPATPAATPTPGAPPPPDLSNSPAVFFAPVPPRPADRPDLPLPDGSVDFMELFEPGAEWELAASRIDGFKLHSWMVRHYLSNDDLVRIAKGLNERGIPLVIEAEPLDPPDPAECDHTESFEGPFEIENLQRLKSLGIEVAMIAIEQPFSFGHVLEGPGSCRYELGRVVDEVIDWIAEARAVYPGIQVGSIEAIWADPPTTVGQYELWLDTYKEMSGEHFAFINIDPNWLRPDWGEVALGIERAADARGIPFGILYNGGLGQTNDEYLAEIAEHMAHYETVLGGTPDQVWIQSWHELPDRVLPETDIHAFTHLINRWFGARAVLDPPEVIIEADGASLVGRLHTPDGAALSGLLVEALASPIDGRRQEAAVSGTVPGGVTSALIAIRVNTEDATPGPSTSTLYSLSFREGDGGDLVPNGDFTAGLAQWGVYGDPLGSASAVATDSGPAIELSATESQQILIDGTRFAVTPGEPYEFRAAFGVPIDAAGTVTVAVIFLDETEVVRTTIVPVPQPITSTLSATTAADGSFRIPLTELDPGRYHFRVSTEGDIDTWFASTEAMLEWGS